MKAEPFVVSPKTYEPALNVLGIRVTVLASNHATLGYEITRQEGEKGMGPPPHSHDWDESFYIVAGEVEFTCAGKTTVCSPGTLVHIPAGTTHSFRYLADSCDVLEVTGQGGTATQMFAAVSRESASGSPDRNRMSSRKRRWRSSSSTSAALLTVRSTTSFNAWR